HRPFAPGTTFVLYVAAYGVFRFLVEFVRGNEVVWQGLTRPQLFLAVTVPIVLLRAVVLWRRGPVERSGVAAPRPQEVTA
ncbi:MAG TPA: prolipoprotein diacylglyceryl transferase family protein, partial [Ornithinibacter sp.]|nr:prolipoprotein diacylglyceryl transferase family protein [Ornithinibacter sp.]